jgi:acyl-CoA dehydrogenase
VSITVEGANILTRSLIIFGQGAIRAHPYVLREIEAARDPDMPRGLAAFEQALFGHVRFALANFARTFVAGITGSHFIGVPADVAPETRRYYQRITRFSSALAFLADVSMGTLGGALKRRESLSARLGDVLSLLYLASATLKRYESEGREAADAPLMHWAIRDSMFKAQTALEGVISNFPQPIVAALARWVVFPFGRPYSIPSDRLSHEVAALVTAPSATRDRLTAGMFIPKSDDDPVGVIERALAATIASEPVEAKLRAAVKDGRLDAATHPGETYEALFERAQAAGLISAAEHELLRRQRILVARVIRVDDFAQDLGTSEMESPQPVTTHPAEAMQPPPRVRAVA